MPSWLTLDRSSLSRSKRKKDSISSPKTVSSPTWKSSMSQAPHSRLHELPVYSPTVSEDLQRGKHGNQKQRAIHKRSETVPTFSTLDKQNLNDDQNAKNFTVGNVGAGGVLYLKPSRAVPSSTNVPVSPSSPSDRLPFASSHEAVPGDSDLSRVWTPHFDVTRHASVAGLQAPPLVLSNPSGRPRSYSCSSIHDRHRSIHHNSNDLPLPASTNDTPRQRRASSTAQLPPRNLTGITIPHYRLGTPRFSDRGTAYLHYSMISDSSSRVTSAVLSHGERDELFPMPSVRGHSAFYSRVSGGGFLRHSGLRSGIRMSRPLPSIRPSMVGSIVPALFDQLEARPDDPAVIRYHPTTGRVIAATPARLIAQITSPQFLDYELLADFFLTFRCFMTCTDVLELLFARMQWAFADGNDAGRIARVRTFVALRHWILNYFVDDFMEDAPVRQSFCDSVNDLAKLLNQRSDGGGGDINIIGELKKCWRRTCALYWPVSDANEVSAHADIVPGGEPQPIPSESLLSLPLTIRPASGRRSVFEITQIPLPDRPAPWGDTAVETHRGNGVNQRPTRVASIPASPASEQSLEVLSCSVPFLRNMRPTARPRQKAAPPRSLVTQGKGSNPNKPRNGHKRSGSFNDALRDHRTPLPSHKADHVEIKDLPSMAITGGLIRGLLLQPSIATVDTYVPVTPGLSAVETTDLRIADDENYSSSAQHSAIGVRKLVGEVRRALSSRKAGSQSPPRSIGSSGSDSRGTAKQRTRYRKPQPDYQQLPGPVRLDILGMRVENAYQDAVSQMNNLDPSLAPQHVREQSLTRGTSRKNVTHESSTQDIEYYSEKPLPEPPQLEPVTSLQIGKQNAESIINVKDASTPYKTDTERLNSHVTTGSRSIVIMDATGAPQFPFMSGALPSFSSASTDMMPIPLFRHRNELLSIPSIPQSMRRSTRVSTTSRLRVRSQDSALRTSLDRMHDLLTEPNTWNLANKSSRTNSRTVSFHPRRSSCIVNSADFPMPSLPHQLRRQPGGDLKAANHIHELLAPPPRRHSTTSLLTASYSFATSGVYSFDDVPIIATALSGNAPEKKTSVSLILSSQPILRPSFVAEAERLKSMPDDIGSNGGIEDALMKLEGKIPSPSMSTFSGHNPGSGDHSGEPGRNSNEEQKEASTIESHGSQPHETLDKQNAGATNSRTRRQLVEDLPKGHPVLAKMPSEDLKMSFEPPTPSTAQFSGDSATLTETQGASIFHPSTSVLNSGSSQTEQLTALPTPNGDPRSSQHLRSSPYPRTGASTPELLPAQFRPDSMLDAASSARYPSFQPGPWGDSVQPSFLLDDNETLSDISTQLSSWHEDDAGVRSFFFDDTLEKEVVEPPVIQSSPVSPTPSSTVGAAPMGFAERRQLQARSGSRNAKRPIKGTISHPRLVVQSANQPFPRRPYTGPKLRDEPIPPTFPSHLPFVLAFESEVIAEQLTIIEKDALDEVDWKDLISLNWSQKPPDVRNWVEYVNQDNTNGIDVIIARFNLVVKWCVSEIVLTEVPSERARAITKYIHIANHCHRRRNYASMYQIILALLSPDLARLHRSWSLVALRDKHMLEHLEKLCRPMRNFHRLRQEMETALPGRGIIPFIGVYTHDLMFNALKSSHIESRQQSGEALINFERYHVAATIVKNLLRLIEASARYDFHPEPEALSRCLWIAALDDHEITARSRALEAI